MEQTTIVKEGVKCKAIMNKETLGDLAAEINALSKDYVVKATQPFLKKFSDEKGDFYKYDAMVYYYEKVENKKEMQVYGAAWITKDRKILNIKIKSTEEWRNLEVSKCVKEGNSLTYEENGDSLLFIPTDIAKLKENPKLPAYQVFRRKK